MKTKIMIEIEFDEKIQTTTNLNNIIFKYHLNQSKNPLTNWQLLHVLDFIRIDIGHDVFKEE